MSNILINIFSYIDLVWQLIAYAITWISLVLSIILNPYLLLMCVLVLSNIYVVLKSKTRAEIVMNYGSFFIGFAKTSYNIINLLIPVIMGLIAFVSRMIAGVMSSPTVVIFGTGVAPGTVLALAIMVLLVLYSIVSII